MTVVSQFDLDDIDLAGSEVSAAVLSAGGTTVYLGVFQHAGGEFSGVRVVEIDLQTGALVGEGPPLSEYPIGDIAVAPNHPWRLFVVNNTYDAGMVGAEFEPPEGGLMVLDVGSAEFTLEPVLGDVYSVRWRWNLDAGGSANPSDTGLVRHSMYGGLPYHEEVVAGGFLVYPVSYISHTAAHPWEPVIYAISCTEFLELGIFSTGVYVIDFLLFDVETGGVNDIDEFSPCVSMPDDDSPTLAAAVHPDGSRLYVPGTNGVHVYSTASFAKQGFIPLGGRPGTIGFTGTGMGGLLYGPDGDAITEMLLCENRTTGAAGGVTVYGRRFDCSDADVTFQDGDEFEIVLEGTAGSPPAE
jgi:hypothetical protein